MKCTTTTPVLIVGGGPTGLLASILLSRLRIQHTLVERRATTLQAPAAHVINTRTLEIYRQAGLDVDALYALNTHPAAHLVTWKGRLESRTLGVFDVAANTDALMAQSRYSREHTTNISQHRLEAYLKAHAQQSTFADIRFGVEWLAFHEGDQHISHLRDESGAEWTANHQYLIAADGASSPIARSLDIRKVGPDALATFLNLTCEVDISKATSESGTLLYWLLDPDVQGTIIVHDPSELSVYMRPIAVPYESVEDYDEARCEQLLRQVFGALPFRVRHKGVWKMTAQVAERFREGSVFLAGDAIHRFPPTGGLGLNTGVGDVHNLVWKLAAVLNGNVTDEAAEALLDSYELERRPVAQANCDVSRRNNHKMAEVIQAVGLDPAKASLVAKVMNGRLVKHLPVSIKNSLYALLTRPARNILDAAAADNDQGRETRAAIAQAIENQREHFSSIGLDLGYVYRDGCAVSPDAIDTPSSEVSSYVESFCAGARLPDGPASSLGDATRVHDLLDYEGFTLFGTTLSADTPASCFGLPINQESIDNLSHAESALGSKSWVLVRPDGHIAASG